MKTKLAIIGMAALLAAGCLTKASKINAVRLGMNREQVLAIMGEPASTTADPSAEYLNYGLAEGFTGGAAAVATPYTIKLVGGKVVFYGRDPSVGYTPQPTTSVGIMVPIR